MYKEDLALNDLKWLILALNNCYGTYLMDYNELFLLQ